MTLKPHQAILSGGLVVGTLDLLDAFVFFGLRSGSTPMRICQSIAGGLLGRATYQHGAASAALGVGVDFFNATAIVAAFYAASRVVPALARHPLIAGPVYGVIVYFFMNTIVIPLSAIGGTFSPATPVFVNGILIHIAGVGLPSVLFARTVPPGRSPSA